MRWPGKDGGYPTVLPTVPDVRYSRIRFFSILTVLAVRITSKLTTPAGAELGCPSGARRVELGSVILLSKAPSLFCSFVLSRVPAFLTLAPGGQQRLKFLRCRLSFILREMGIEILPWLRAGRPEIGHQL
jgi:hypothetical protein